MYITWGWVAFRRVAFFRGYRFYRNFEALRAWDWRPGHAIFKTVRIFEIGPVFLELWPLGGLGHQVTHFASPPASRPAGKWAVMGRESAKISQNRPFLPQYRPDMAMIWSHMASIPMSISHTTSTSPMCPPLADILAEMGRDMLQISQILLKISHF